jgi:pimeloyl-ACP methyl ester carboxylesterase
LGIESAVIIGTSLGGLMAMIMADQQPERLRGVIMNDVGPDIPPAAIARILDYVGRTPAQADWTGAALLARQNYEIAWPEEDDAFWDHQVRIAWRQTDEGRVTPDYDPAIGDALRYAAKATGLVRFLQRLGVRRLKGVNLDPWDNFRTMDMPVLLIKGALSDLVSSGSIGRMRGVKPDLKVVEIPNRGHAPTLDEAVAREAIDRFLASIQALE